MNSNAWNPEAVLKDDGFLVRAARALLRDADAADDVAQEARFAALSGAPKDVAPRRAWLRTVIGRLASRRRTAELRRERREAAAARPEGAPSVADVVAREELRRRIVDAVLALDADARDAVLLRWYADLPPREAAARLGVPVETFRTRLKRAHQKLRERLDAAHGGDRAAWTAPLLALADLRDLAALGGATGTAATSGTTSGAGAKVAGATAMATKTKAAATLIACALMAWVVRSALKEEPRGADPPSTSAGARGDGPARRADANSVEPIAAVASAPYVDPEESAAASRATTPSDATGVLRARLVWDEDGSPAAGVAAYFVDGGAPRPPAYSTALVRADASGALPPHRAPPGNVGVYAHRDGSQWFAVAAGRETTGEVRLARGVDVDVAVTDRDDRPIAHAEIWLSLSGVSVEGAIVAETDADGRAFVRGVPTNSLIAATKRGRIPCPALQVRGATGERIQLKLTLDDGGGALEGTVRDAAGRPVRDAVVRVGASELGTHDVPGAVPRTNAPPPRIVAADEAGAWRVDGLAPGSTPVFVLATGHPEWTGVAEVSAGAVARCDVVLHAGVEIDGIVLDAEGAPCKSVRVAVGFSGRPGHALDRAATTGPDGRFRFAGVPAGTIDLRANAGARGAASETFEAADGATRRVELKLSRSRLVAGRVIEADGTPARGVQVDVVRRKAGGYDENLGESMLGDAAQGRFAFNLNDDAPVRVEVRTNADQVIASADDVRPGGPELVLKIAADARPSCLVVGRLVDEAGLPLRGGDVVAWDAGRRIGRSADTDEATGRFKTPKLHPGLYYLEVEVEGRPKLDLGARTLAAGETLDLGDVRFEKPATLVAALRPPAGVVFERPIAFVRSAGGVEMDCTVEDGVVRATLAPGRYTLAVDPSDDVHAPYSVAFEATPGGDVKLDLAFERGVRRCVTVRDARTPKDGTPTMDVAVKDDRGVALVTYGVGAESTICPPLRPGRYVVEATSPDGRSASMAFDVVEGAADVEVPTLVLK